MKNNISPITSWLKVSSKTTVIAGPCSAESHDQMLNTARALDKIKQVSIFRSGIWKPRTRPGSFEGVGEKAFPWLYEIKQQTSLKTMVEVGTPRQTELCLKNRQAVDMLWIGARTTVSPFAIQEIADVLKGTDIPLFVKNPMHPDLDLWIGAFERFIQAGIHKIAAIHRGFFPATEHLLRNVPHWDLVEKLKLHFPQLSVINDPSHISGRRDLVSTIAHEAIIRKFDGLMIETHYDPRFALSDAKQQITPFELEQLLNTISAQTKELMNQKIKVL